ncbi:hypothetical protein AB0C07_12135 [Actinoplanes missouriensis]|uniref:hypothetical protein n=1 Tax=Actinoplanes missouriensis TaxID=1866 RepID=UPI0034098E5C
MWLGRGRPDSVYVLVPGNAPHPTGPAVTVDGRDVEAVLRAVADAAQTARADDSACLLRMPAYRSDRRDPVDVLAGRMFAAHQLDANAFEAIDADARRVAALGLHAAAAG